MVELLIDEAIVLDQPPLSIAWTSHLADVLTLLGRTPAPLDPRHGGMCVLKDTTFLGLPFESTLFFDGKDTLGRARFEPPRDPPDPDDAEPEGIIPEPLALQMKRHAPSILARRATLEAALGPGEALTTRGLGTLPCPEMRWRFRRSALTHYVVFSVERGDDKVGWLIDHVEVTHDPSAD
jgi:hypothetical protein